MAPPRKSLAQARLSGAMAKNPQRYRDRAEPLVTEALGDPPDWLKPSEVDAWEDMRERLPWLNQSHRCITALAAHLHARMAAGTLGVPGLNLLRIIMGSLGATPTTSHKVQMPEPQDPDDGLFQR